MHRSASCVIGWVRHRSMSLHLPSGVSGAFLCTVRPLVMG